MKLFLNWVLSALSLLIVSFIVPGFEVSSFFSALAAALILGLANIVVKPILVVLTLPVTVVTFGLFLFVINALMLLLVSSIVKGFDVAGFGPALIGAVVLTLISWAFDAFTKNEKAAY